jgi:hypothetical protein
MVRHIGSFLQGSAILEIGGNAGGAKRVTTHGSADTPAFARRWIIA